MFKDPTIVIQAELSPGESLLWSGQPCQGFLFRKSDIGLVPFSLVLCGLVVSSVVDIFVTKGPASSHYGLFLFGAICLFLIVGRFRFDAHQRAHTYYGVTNERIVIITLWPNKRVMSVNLRRLSDTSLNRGPGRVETISFGPYNASAITSAQSAPCFEMRSDAHSVCDLIFSAQNQSTATLVAEGPIFQRLHDGNRHAALGDSYNALQSHIVAGEKLLWAGQPRRGIIFRTGDWYMVPFSFVWGGLMLFAAVSAIQANAPPTVEIFLLPFVLAGLQMMLGRFLYNALQRAGTYLGVTTERVLLVTNWPFQKIQTVNLRTLSEMSYEERKGRSGTVTFGRSHRSSRGGNSIFTGADAESAPGFEGIADAKAVHDLIRHAQKSAMIPPP